MQALKPTFAFLQILYLCKELKIKKSTLCILAALALQACVVRTPSPAISSSVIEADGKNGNLISIDGSFCGVLCEKLALEKAQEVCPAGLCNQELFQTGH
ncbi:hypothetical protein [Eikenella halliae]|uniref:Uncharacterized protein n=1 Tax=Eikenella halliae TaxID=1795832 RepID=A0A1B6VVB7_9NEIS|nr:hypothetical protein [Eikenella halliae]OAM37463.1 hypothetical protein A7Q00_11080 [Eikenella halliae]